MRYLATLLLFPAVALANPGDSVCARASDAVNNLANRTLSGADETVLLNALNAQMGGASNATTATKCQNALTYLHNAVKGAVIAHKTSQVTPQNSSEVD